MPRQKPAPFFATLHKGGVAFVCVGVVTLFEAFSLTFFTLYAVRNGFAVAGATALLSFGIAACVLFFFAIGYAGDHWSRRGTIAVCAGVALAASLLQMALITTAWIWPLIVILRASAFGSYIGGFALLGDKFKGPEMVAASSINSVMWGVTGIVGPPLAGLAFDVYGLWLLPWFMAACFVPVLAVSTLRAPGTT